MNNQNSPCRSYKTCIFMSNILDSIYISVPPGHTHNYWRRNSGTKKSPSSFLMVLICFLYLIRSTNCNFSTSLVFFKFIQSLFQYKNLHPYLINNLLKLFVTLSGWIFKSPIIIKRSFDKRTSHITTH